MLDASHCDSCLHLNELMIKIRKKIEEKENDNQNGISPSNILMFKNDNQNGICQI